MNSFYNIPPKWLFSQCLNILKKGFQIRPFYPWTDRKFFLKMSKMSWDLSTCYLPPTSPRYMPWIHREKSNTIPMPAIPYYLFNISSYVLVSKTSWSVILPLGTLISTCYPAWPDQCRTTSLPDVTCLHPGNTEGYSLESPLAYYAINVPPLPSKGIPRKGWWDGKVRKKGSTGDFNVPLEQKNTI